MLDPSAYTLGPANGGGGGGGGSGGSSKNQSPVPSPGAGPRERVVVQDARWRFPDESQLPKPRSFQGGHRKYRAGRGSSVPLDLGAL